MAWWKVSTTEKKSCEENDWYNDETEAWLSGPLEITKQD